MLVEPSSQASTPLEAIHKGLNAAFYTCAGFAFLATGISATCLFGIGKVGHRDKKPSSAEEGALEIKSEPER